MTTFARRLKDLMIQEEITQTMLAEWLGCHRPKVAHWLNDDVSPKLEDVYKIARIFKVSPTYLVGESEYEDEGGINNV